MKGCVFLQGNYAKIAHALAVELQDYHGVDQFCAYVISQRAHVFAQEQQEIAYTRLFVDHEVHDKYVHEVVDPAYLAAAEAQYGTPTFWNDLYADRRLMFSMDSEAIQTMSLDSLYTHEDILKIMQVRIRETVAFLTEEKPDFILIFSMGIVGTMLTYHIAKRMGIKVLVMDSVRIGNLMTFTEDFQTITGVQELFTSMESSMHASPFFEEAQNILRNFKTTKSLRLSYTIDNLKPPAITLKSRLQTYKNIWAQYREQNHHKHGYDVAVAPWRVAYMRLLQKWRALRGYADLYSQPNWQDRIVFYPLQYEPEASLLNIAPFAWDQLVVIRAVARSLPLQYTLYVKEHPAMVNRRTRAYYQELLKIPNVRLIDPATKSFDIIEHATLVTTITGTAGWEATLYGRPVISFGHVFYNMFPTVKRCSAWEALPVLIQEQLTAYQYSEKQVIHFLAAILENGALDLSYYPMEYMNPADILHHPEVSNVARFLARKLSVA